jgi:hypothetical protein
MKNNSLLIIIAAFIIMTVFQQMLIENYDLVVDSLLANVDNLIENCPGNR